jgi:predicted lipid-binding transport protein (Tim44 family)
MNVRRQEMAAAREPKRSQAPARPPEPPKPKLRVLPTLRARRRRAGVLGLLGCALLFGFLVGLTAFQAQLAQNQIMVDQVARDLRAEQLKFDHSRLRIAQLQAPDVILAKARKLGMHPPAANSAPSYIPSSSDIVTEVLIAASGGPDVQVPSASATRPDWASYKQITGEQK